MRARARTSAVIASGCRNGKPIAPASRSPTKTGTASAPDAYGARAAPSGSSRRTLPPLRPGWLSLSRCGGDRRPRGQREARAGPKRLALCPARIDDHELFPSTRPSAPRRSPSAHPRPSRSPPARRSGQRRATQRGPAGARRVAAIAPRSRPRGRRAPGRVASRSRPRRSRSRRRSDTSQRTRSSREAIENDIRGGVIA